MSLNKDWLTLVDDTVYTGRFIMFSITTNMYNKKTKGPTLMELFTATGKMKKFFLTTRNVRCVTRGAHIEHPYLSKKETFSVLLWLWTIPLRYVLWFSCYKCL